MPLRTFYGIVGAVRAPAFVEIMPQSSAGELQYTVSEGVVTITGYTGAGGNVVIPTEIDDTSVVVIGNYAFLNQTSIVNVSIPDSLRTIGSYAFQGCTLLTSISLK